MAAAGVEGGPFRLSGRRILIFSGRLDHRQDLVSALGLGAAEEAQLGDGALFARAWDRWGEEALRRADGIFASAVWSPSTRTLTAMCSPLRAAPLLFFIGRRRAVVATAPRQVFAWAAIERRLNDVKLAGVMFHNFGVGRESLYEDVSWLLPGETLQVTPRTWRIRRFYDLAERVESGPEAPASLDDCVEGTREALRAAVASALRGSDPPGIAMSGGIDSTSVAVTALDLLAEGGSTRSLMSFTAVPDPKWRGRAPRGRMADESRLVRTLVAKYPALVPRFVDTAGWSVRRDVRDLGPLFRLAEAPPATIANANWSSEAMELARAAGCRLMLLGGDGNATLSCDGSRRLAALLATGRFAAFLRLALALPRGRRWGVASPVWQNVVKPVLLSRTRGRGNRGFHRWLHDSSAINPAFAKSTRVAERVRERVRRGAIVRARTARRDTQVRMLSGLEGQREGRSRYVAIPLLYGMPSRDPLGERRFAEWCLRLPDDQYTDLQGQRRLLAKRVMEGRLPAEILYNERRGYQSPDWHFRLTRDLGWIKDTFESWRSDPAVAGRLDLNRLLDHVDRWPADGPLPDDPDYALCRGVAAALLTGTFIRWFESGYANDASDESPDGLT